MLISQYAKITLHLPGKPMPCRKCAKIDAAYFVKGVVKIGDWYVAPSQKAKSVDGRVAWKVLWRCRACGKFSHPRYTKPVDFSGGDGRTYREYSMDPEFIANAEETRQRGIDERRKKGENVDG